MDLIVKRPIYVKGAVLLEGSPLVTNEQHARELLRMGYAAASEPKKADAKKDDAKLAKSARAKPGEAE